MAAKHKATTVREGVYGDDVLAGKSPAVVPREETSRFPAPATTSDNLSLLRNLTVSQEIKGGIVFANVIGVGYYLIYRSHSLQRLLHKQQCKPPIRETNP